MKTNYVYHWTHRNNLRSIGRKGLLTSKTQGLLAAVWCCTDANILWAAAHVAQRHGWNPDAMVCLKISAKYITLTRTALAGVFVVKQDIAALHIDSVLHSIGEGWEKY